MSWDKGDLGVKVRSEGGWEDGNRMGKDGVISSADESGRGEDIVRGALGAARDG